VVAALEVDVQVRRAPLEVADQGGRVAVRDPERLDGVLGRDRAGLDAGLAADVDLPVARFEPDLRGEAGRERNEGEQQLPIPVVAGRGGFSFWRVQLDAVGGIMQYVNGDDEVSVVDLDAMGRIRVLGDGDRAAGWLTVGYRYTDLDLEYVDSGDQVKANLDFSGPYLGLRVSF